MTREKNVARGRRAKAAGDSAEAFWEAQHQMAVILKILVHWMHNQPGVKHVHGKIIYAEKSASDYTGTRADGRSHCAESKSVLDGRLLRSAVKPRQAAQLDAVARAGGRAYLLVEFRSRDALPIRAAIPWLDVPWRTLRSAESIGVEDVAEYAVRPNECYLRPGVVAPVVISPQRRYPRE
jgi:hypothetical protein